MATNNLNNSGAASSAPRPRQRRKSTGRRVAGMIGKVLGTLLLICVCTGAIMACYAVVYVQTVVMPQAKQTNEALGMFDVSLSSMMYYTDKATGEHVEMLTLRETEDRVWVSYDQIPQNLINATIAIEDKRFYKHQGVDWIRTGYGVFSMFAGEDIQGGSTLTQQLIKNLTQNNEVTVKRKVLEIFTALEFEKTHSKDDIMEWYLNYIYLGDNCNGVYTAALNYFGKEPQDLTLAECASLISITNGPTLYNPYRNPEKNLERRDKVLYQMYDQEMITEEEYNAAVAEPLNLKRETGTSREQEVFTWYEDQVIKDVVNDLMDAYDVSLEYANNWLYHGGLRIETCFDPDVQSYVDAAYNDRSAWVLDSPTGQEIQSAITVIDNSTGNVVAMAGGIGEKELSRSFNRATDTLRPPGSSIKPLAVYAPGLDMGLITPYTVVDDTPINLNGDAWPVNSYGYYKGLTTVYEALEDSVNTIAVKVLRDYVTPNASFQFLADKFGINLVAAKEINGETKSDIDLAPLALGGLTEGVSTYEMAAAYATFANNGMYKTPRTYLRVTSVDTDGKERVLLENESSSAAVLKESTVYYMNTMLQNVIKNGTGKAADFSGMTIAGKTGTTTSRKDLWFAGYSSYYTAAVWVGYDQQERIDSSGNYMAAQLWKKVMEPLHSGLADQPFRTPNNLVTETICLDSGMIATEACAQDPRGGRVTKVSFVSGDQPVQYCTVHTTVEVCKDSPVEGVSGMYHLASEFCPEESRTTISVLNYQRERATESVVARDDAYLKSTLEALENGGLCDVHTEPIPEEPKEFDPDDPSTWPLDDPNFDPFDPTTYPYYSPGHEVQDPIPEPPAAPSEGGDPDDNSNDDPGGDPEEGGEPTEGSGWDLWDPSTWFQ